MFFRLKKSGERAYVQIVENKRIEGAVRQSVVATLGRADELEATGALASLLASGAKLTDQVMLITALDQDEGGALAASAKRLGGPLLFGRIWARLGIPEVLADLLADRGFEFSVESAVFVATLHRLFVSGSDRDCAAWMQDYDIAGAAGLDLHHFYRAMAWLGEEMGEKAEGALAPRCVKDVVEEKLFEKRRDLFCDLSAVFMDTTSLSFYGEGGETLGERGMISGATIEGLEARGLDYILGARERSDATVRKIVLENDAPFTPLFIERRAGETQLFVKEVKVDGKRYVVCRNEAEAEKDRQDREKIVAALDAQLQKGDKALIGNSAYRRYLRKAKEAKDKRAFEIDAGKLAEEARYDGIFVLRTNARVTPLQAVLRYRDLLQVEELFRRSKAIMRTRPIFHSSDAAIRGHVFCSFLALAMQKHLEDLMREAKIAPEWKELLRDLDRLQQLRIQHRGADWLVRTDAAPSVTALFRAAHVALPPRAGQTAPPKPQAPPASAKKRPGRPRRSATTPRISPQTA